MPLAAYCYVRVVGRGSYGEVTLVKHRRDGRQVREAGARYGRGGPRALSGEAGRIIWDGVSMGNLSRLSKLGQHSL